MTALLSVMTPAERVRAHDLWTKKGLGQHFLLDLNITRKIVSLAGNLKGVTVFEIGPGPGGLTQPLIESEAAKIIAVEKDHRCIEALQDLVQAAAGRFDLREDDALVVDLSSLAPAPRAIVANLPYNVGTPLLLGWLKKIDDFQSLTLMFQAEVVDRLVAAPGSKTYGRLSVMTQFCARARRALTVPASAFTPPPKIASAIVHLEPRKDRPQDIAFETMEKVVAAAFAQRRKMLRSALKPLGGEALLEKARIDPTARAEDLDLVAFETLARATGLGPGPSV